MTFCVHECLQAWFGAYGRLGDPSCWAFAASVT
jgi:hypothetical protein